MPSYRAFLPDLGFYQQGVACQSACPVRTDARAYVSAIARGEFERAYLIARETNPFASTCGWVCGAPCEAACRRGKIDAPIAIRALKRFVNDRYGVFLRERGQAPAGDWPAYVGSREGFDLGNTRFPTSRSGLVAGRPEHADPHGPVAVVGSGPAGLSCAHDLALMGYSVTIYEAAPAPGGMLRLGVPEYRLPRALLDLEIEAVLSLGPELRLGQALGRDFSLEELRRDYRAVFLGIGTHQSRRLNIEGEQLDGVLRAVDFLINVNLRGYNLDLGKHVLVIGGGNVAMDVARTAARLGEPAESGGDLEMALDVARTAVRLGKTEQVECLVVEDRREMLADALEIQEAEREGVVIRNHLAPKRLLPGPGKTLQVETLDVARAFDERGRFNPQLVAGTERSWECDSVIVAIGQTGEFGWIRPEDGLEVTPRGGLAVDAETLMTTAPGVFAGGDVAFGPRLIINAVADGQRAARGIRAYLEGSQPRTVRRGYFTPISRRDYPAVGPGRNYLKSGRSNPPNLPVDRRIGVASVELAFPEEQARLQGGRCLICSIQPIFDGDRCILCNGCVDVCPMDCLKLVPVEAVAGDAHVATLIHKRTAEWPSASAMLLDPARCIRCGLCAARCPTDAVRMESFRFTEEVIFDPRPAVPS